MSMETRSSSALFKRAEQLKRWEESETNRESPIISDKTRKIKFSAGCVFLAACAAGDKEEVIRLIQTGADIDTANVDGLTALHQACIDDNLDMVEFLVDNGADVNRGDNEGWTPLHATASCGFISIAKYLIEHGANVAAVNNDGELPLDIAESDEMEDMLQQHIDEQGIDCDEARNKEERIMLDDAKDWLNNGEIKDIPHPKTGASSLLVAAAKGYIKVMDILLQAGVDVNAQDFDGWTPLHAAAHWGQKKACEILVENFCDMDRKNLVGQTALDLADTDMVKVLEELRKKQAVLQRDRRDIFTKKIQPKRRLSNDKSNISNKEISWEKERLQEDLTFKDKISLDIPQVELQIQPETPNTISEDDPVEKKNRANRDEKNRIPTTPEVNKTVPINPVPSLPPKQGTAESDDSLVPSWRRPGSFRNRGGEIQNRNLTLRLGEKDNTAVLKVTSPTGTPQPTDSPQEVGLRRTQSFEADEKFYKRYCELRAKINAGNSCPALHAVSLPIRSASLKEKHYTRRGLVREDTRLVSPTGIHSPLLPSSCVATASTTATTTTVTTPVSTNTTTVTTPSPQHTSIGRSFVPPVRDEESETQRKAHAKRVRETRRSTQGVTLEEIKSAEQLVKKKNQQQLQQATQQLNNIDQPAEVESPVILNATITTGEPTVPPGERRPSWRLRVDNGCKFMLEDARSSTGGNNSIDSNRQSAPVSEAALRRTFPSPTVPRPVSAPVTDTADTTVTIALRRQTKPPDDKEDKENDIRNAQATQAVIQRRRRPKRRSTGVVHVDMEEIDRERQDQSSGGPAENEATRMNNSESGTEKSGRSSRLSSTSASEPRENGELDYKKLYEESILENERLREKLRKTEEDLNEAKSSSDQSLSPIKNSLSEMEKRERRAMERKLSEMEEELKQFQKLKAENERLRAENRALTRVVSKLTASANAGK